MLDVHKFADLTRINHRLKCDEVRSISEHVADRYDAVVFLCVGEDLATFFLSLCSRLLEKYVIAHFQCLQTLPDLAPVGKTNHLGGVIGSQLEGLHDK